MNQHGREVVTEDTFKRLKKQDDDIRRQLIEVTKKKGPPAHEYGQSPKVSPTKSALPRMHLSKSVDRRPINEERSLSGSPRSENSEQQTPRHLSESDSSEEFTESQYERILEEKRREIEKSQIIMGA